MYCPRAADRLTRSCSLYGTYVLARFVFSVCSLQAHLLPLGICVLPRETPSRLESALTQLAPLSQLMQSLVMLAHRVCLLRALTYYDT